VEAPGIERALPVESSTTPDNTRVHPAGNAAGSQPAETGEGQLSTTGVSDPRQIVSSVSEVIDEVIRLLERCEVEEAKTILLRVTRMLAPRGDGPGDSRQRE
jgi:hypothetical protein